MNQADKRLSEDPQEQPVDAKKARVVVNRCEGALEVKINSPQKPRPAPLMGAANANAPAPPSPQGVYLAASPSIVQPKEKEKGPAPFAHLKPFNAEGQRALLLGIGPEFKGVAHMCNKYPAIFDSIKTQIIERDKLLFAVLHGIDFSAFQQHHAAIIGDLGLLFPNDRVVIAAKMSADEVAFMGNGVISVYLKR